ncbi:hypothetical protein LguiB_031543 [Lonicera macranthoides]
MWLTGYVCPADSQRFELAGFLLIATICFPFNHPKNSQIPVNATFVAGDSSFSDKRLVNSLLVDMNTGVVTFDIAIKVDTDNIYVASADAICKDVTMWISSHGGVWKLSGGTKQCRITTREISNPDTHAVGK